MSLTSKVTEQGQTTLPAKVREVLRAKPGDTLEYEVTQQGVLMRIKQPGVTDPDIAKTPGIAKTLQAYRGVFGKSVAQSSDDALKEQRDRRGWDEQDAELFKTWADE
jgi:AbrB family looped-hinge helix DNA binding protein